MKMWDLRIVTMKVLNSYKMCKAFAGECVACVHRGERGESLSFRR